jgi:hypothetical protein
MDYEHSAMVASKGGGSEDGGISGFPFYNSTLVK